MPKIIYDRRRVAEVVEIVNGNNHALKEPVTMKEISEQVVEQFFDGLVREYKGIIFIYEPYMVEDWRCHLYTKHDYSADEMLFEIDITERSAQEVQKFVKEIMDLEELDEIMESIVENAPTKTQMH